jgi:hypothetical protein
MARLRDGVFEFEVFVSRAVDSPDHHKPTETTETRQNHSIQHTT